MESAMLVEKELALTVRGFVRDACVYSVCSISRLKKCGVRELCRGLGSAIDVGQCGEHGNLRDMHYLRKTDPK